MASLSLRYIPKKFHLSMEIPITNHCTWMLLIMMYGSLRRDKWEIIFTPRKALECWVCSPFQCSAESGLRPFFTRLKRGVPTLPAFSLRGIVNVSTPTRVITYIQISKSLLGGSRGEGELRSSSYKLFNARLGSRLNIYIKVCQLFGNRHVFLSPPSLVSAFLHHL